MPDAISEARRRHEQSLLRDGLAEILTGVIVLQQIAGDQIIHSGNVPARVIYFVALLLFVIFLPRMLRAVRERLSYPRSGYVQELPRRRRKVVLLIAATLPPAVTFAYLRYCGGTGGENPDELLRWVPALAGVGLGALLFHAGIRNGFRRYFALGIFSTVLGIGLSLETPWDVALTAWCTGVGCAFLCSGGIALSSYLRTPQHPASQT